MFVVYIDYRQLRGAAVDLAGKRVVTPVSRFCLGYDVSKLKFRTGGGLGNSTTSVIRAVISSNFYFLKL